LLGPGAVFIDGGANVGEQSIIAAASVGRSGRVHSFEPDPEAFEQLERTVRCGRFSNITANHCLLGEQSRKMSFYLHPQSQQSSVSPRFDPSSQHREVQQDAVSLDDYWSAMGAGNVDMIKLDLEGYELPVLRGGRSLLEQELPLLVLEVARPEDRAAAFGYGVADVLRHLTPLGYTFYVLRGARLQLIAESSEIFAEDTDLFCVHERSRIYEAAASLIRAAQR
jgi:FkbM family methyltransferase